jgi:hypothetical protein
VVHEQEPTFFNRQVLVNVSFGFRVVPSGMVTSSMNWATSQLWVGGAEVGGTLVVAMASVAVAKPAVLVGGMVGGFRIAPCVILAAAVWAAEVRTMFASGVGVMLEEGRLQADILTTSTNIRITRRVVLIISLPPGIKA